MFYKWGGSDILSISTFNQIFKDTQSCRCYPVDKKIRDYLGTFPKRGGGSPIPKTLSKFTNMVLEYHLKNDLKKKKIAPWVLRGRPYIT